MLAFRGRERGHMHSDTHGVDEDGPPTEEIYIELSELEATAEEDADDPTVGETAPVLAEDERSGVKGRIAKLRAILTDRGAELPH